MPELVTTSCENALTRVLPTKPRSDPRYQCPPRSRGWVARCSETIWWSTAQDSPHSTLLSWSATFKIRSSKCDKVIAPDGESSTREKRYDRQNAGHVHLHGYDKKSKCCTLVCLGRQPSRPAAPTHNLDRLCRRRGRTKVTDHMRIMNSKYWSTLRFIVSKALSLTN